MDKLFSLLKLLWFWSTDVLILVYFGYYSSLDIKDHLFKELEAWVYVCIYNLRSLLSRNTMMPGYDCLLQLRTTRSYSNLHKKRSYSNPSWSYFGKYFCFRCAFWKPKLWRVFSFTSKESSILSYCYMYI